jgi:hypothetical protein
VGGTLLKIPKNVQKLFVNPTIYIQNIKKNIYIKISACAVGKYGPGCKNTCNENCKGCHYITGYCEKGCNDGWIGKKCENRKLIN